MRRVDLLIEPGQSLGLMIRGGAEYGLGIFVTGVDKGSVADRAGLQVSFYCIQVALKYIFTICPFIQFRLVTKYLK